MAGGRPSKYNEKLAKDICNKIMKGMSLRKICEAKGMPDRGSVFNWVMDYEEFFNQYHNAMDIRLETRMEELQDLCQNAIDNPELVQAYKLKINTLQWEASKLKSKKYGDKQEITHDVKAIPDLIIKVNDDK